MSQAVTPESGGGRRLRHPQTCAMQLVPFYYGWVVLACSCMLMLASIAGHTTGINMAIPHFVEDLGMTRSGVSAMWFFAMLVSGSMVPVAGAIADRFGSRLVVQLSLLPYVAVVAATGQVRSVGQLVVCTVLLRFFGPEVLTLVAGVTPNKWFHKRRGRVAAVISICQASLAGFAPFFQALIDACVRACVLGHRQSHHPACHARVVGRGICR
jgi:OFA family oxalate/formate antiporter-like MFS transporter